MARQGPIDPIFVVQGLPGPVPEAPYRFLDSTTPLHLAVLGGCKEYVRILLDHGHGVTVGATDIRHRTPLYLAAEEGHAECLMLLLDRTDDSTVLSIPTKTRRKALQVCLSHGEKMRGCIKKMVAMGADVGHHDAYGISAVHEAVKRGWDMDMIKLLILEGRGMDFDRGSGESPLRVLMNRQLRHYRSGVEMDPPFYTDAHESAALLFLRMGATRNELKKLLWHELNLPKQPGVLLETLMDSFSSLPSLSDLDAEVAVSTFQTTSHYSGHTLWRIPTEGWTEEARQEVDERLKAVVAEKKQLYHQRSAEVPSLAHLSRAAIRSSLQADVRMVISWPVPQCIKRYILLGHDL